MADSDPRFIILIDRSLSMATEVTRPWPSEATNRLEAAKELAACQVKDIFEKPLHSLVSVMCFTALRRDPVFVQNAPEHLPPRVQVVLNFSDSLEEVLDAIDKIPGPAETSCLAEALCFTASVLQAQPDPADKFLYVYTDGGQNDWDWVNVLGPTCSGCFDSHPFEWLPACNPHGGDPCSGLQACLAENLIWGLNPIIWRVTYFGPVAFKFSGHGTSHPDFNFLKYLGRSRSDGWFDHFYDDALFALQIEMVFDVEQGRWVQVPVNGLMRGPRCEPELRIGGVDLQVAYDVSALTFLGATPGEWLDTCDWEYFTYRYGANGNCGDACSSGLLRIIAIADINNGPYHPSCFSPPDTDPHELAEMTFLVTDDRTFECQFVPIRFFWMDCGDNTISSKSGDTLFVSDHVYDFEGTDITDPTYGFPTYFGIQQECFDSSQWYIDPETGDTVYKVPLPFIDFVNGGIDIVCAESLDTRGDVNLNGVSNEVADAVLFSNYFIYGLGVFHINPDGQIAATDVNADGMVLTVGDLVYQIRIVVGDAQPYPKLTPVVATYAVDNGVVSVNAEMGAAYVVAEGNVTPTLLADNMEMKCNYDAEEDVTRILVYSMENGQTFAGAFLDVEGKVVSIEMATYEGAPVTSTLLPTAFALHQNYPNPFNPITTISFTLPVATDYELAIYNVMGQVVASFTGRSEPGIVKVDWDASKYASGVYLYKLIAGNFTDTKKMVLLK
jgi:hypothetical protein